jgi:hypothetical protein
MRLDLKCFLHSYLGLLCHAPSRCWHYTFVLHSHFSAPQGTEYYDAPTKLYIDFPITDVLQVNVVRWKDRLSLIV